MSWINSFLRSDKPESSNRLNQLIVVLNYLPVGFVLAWVIWYQAVYRKEGVQWNDMAWFMGAMTAFYASLFGMKALNKSQENKEMKSNSSGDSQSLTQPVNESGN